VIPITGHIRSNMKNLVIPKQYQVHKLDNVDKMLVFLEFEFHTRRQVEKSELLEFYLVRQRLKAVVLHHERLKDLKCPFRDV
jgi:hypothetical protein